MEQHTKVQIYHHLHPEAGIFEIMKATNTDNQESLKLEIDISSGNCSVCGRWSRTLLGEVCAHWSCRKMLRRFNSE